MTPQTGYGAAQKLHAERIAQGWQAVGRKIGFTNRNIWPRYGVYEPIWGTVYDRTLIVAQGGRATVPLEGLAHPRIEPEICFGLKSAPPPGSRDPEALLAAIDWVAHAVEIVQCRNENWKVTLEEATAQNGLHGCLVLGTPIPVADLPDLAAKLPRLKVVLSKGSAVQDSGVGANVLDSPLFALAFLAGAVDLAPGELISTGTLTDAHPVKAGETWRTSFSGLPIAGLTVDFT
jgi:2-oxo-3-hexenedioate decarboxylase